MSSCPVLQSDEAFFKHVNTCSTIKGKVNPKTLSLTYPDVVPSQHIRDV